MFKVGDKVKLNKDLCDTRLSNLWYNKNRNNPIVDRVAIITGISSPWVFFEEEGFCPGGWHYKWFIKAAPRVQLIKHKRIK